MNNEIVTIGNPPDVIDLWHEAFKAILKTYNDTYPNLHPSVCLDSVVCHIQEKIRAPDYEETK